MVGKEEEEEGRRRRKKKKEEEKTQKKHFTMTPVSRAERNIDKHKICRKKPAKLFA